MPDPADPLSDDLRSALESLGFVPVQTDRRKHVIQFARRPNQFLTEWVHDDGTELLFTWEFDLGEFCTAMEWQIGAAETSFQILYPQFDVKIARDVEAVAIEVSRLEEQMRQLDLADPSL